MQIDIGSHKKWLDSHDWRDPVVNLTKGTEILREAFEFLDGKDLEHANVSSADTARDPELRLRATLDGYNAYYGAVWSSMKKGRDPDYITTHSRQKPGEPKRPGDYGGWVVERANTYRAWYEEWQRRRAAEEALPNHCE